ncbi:MAG: Vacuolar H+transporting two-sector ATPase F subunit [Hyphomicrobiales bacterium]|nr:MAG: Vacuolar H+transporting two-sector ATPase F subunit [Hyphomicrobiales bacterium]
MNPVIVIGDEVTCSGFRLAGVETRVPAPDAIDEAVTSALGEAAFVVLTAPVAVALSDERLAALRVQESPLVVVMPDIRRGDPAAALDALKARVLGVLGVET